MDNPAVKNDTTQPNATYPKSKALVRMESAVSSVTSTQELIDMTSQVNFNSTPKAGKIRAMITNCSRRMLLAIICLLLIGILTITTLYVLEYHTKKETLKVKELAVKQCLEITPDTVLNEIPDELKSLLPAIESKINSMAKQFGIKAFSYGIAYNGKLWWTFHYGHKNFSNPASPAPDNDTPYPVASLTKLFTATMLMKLIEKGIIKSTDDQISKYDPEFKVKNPFGNEHISFRQLLCMTTGLPREAPCNPPTDHNFCPYNTTEMWRRISNIELEVRPNAASIYSNLGFSVLGRVMERILNGTKYEDWIQREILDKLGLKNSGFQILKRYNSIPVSQDNDGKVTRIIDWGWLRPAGGLYTSLNDLHKFTNELIERRNTTLLLKSSKRRIFSHETESALGCPIVKWKLLTDTKVEDDKKRFTVQNFYTFNGLVAGYSSYWRVSPENTLATYGLSANGGNYIALGGLEAQLGNLVFDAVAKALKRKNKKYQAPNNMEAYVGTYRLTSYWPLIKDNVSIKVVEGRLSIRLEWFSADLTYISPWKVKTVYQYDKDYCQSDRLATGLLNNIYIFDKPVNGSNKCPGFRVNSISAFGYASFARV